MTESEARDRLRSMVACASEPGLSEKDLDNLLSNNRLADSSGLAPDDENWDPTYDLWRAAAMGWELKAGRVSDLVSTAVGGRTTHSNQVFAQCMEMAKSYRRRMVSSRSVNVAT